MDGTSNEDPLEWMTKSQCGVPDFPIAFSLSKEKWHKTRLTWYFALSIPQMYAVAIQAFDLWQNVALCRIVKWIY